MTIIPTRPKNGSIIKLALGESYLGYINNRHYILPSFNSSEIQLSHPDYTGT